MSLSFSSLANHRTKTKGTKDRGKTSRHTPRLFNLPCCSKWLCVSRMLVVNHGRGHQLYGDLHGLQHLLHCLYRAFVLLGTTTGQLHDRKGRWKTERWWQKLRVWGERIREDQLIRSRHQLNQWRELQNESLQTGHAMSNNWGVSPLLLNKCPFRLVWQYALPNRMPTWLINFHSQWNVRT